MNHSLQNFLKNINLKETFLQLGLSNFYEFIRTKIVMNNTSLVLILTVLFIFSYLGIVSDKKIISYISSFIIFFLVFFRLTMMF